MESYVIRGGNPLKGEIEVSGAKNAAVAILASTVLVDGVMRIENIPKVKDVTYILEILNNLGARVRLINDNTMEIDARGLKNHCAPYEVMRQFRASYYFIGSLLGRFGRAQVAMPGGCDFGVRPIDLHIKGFTALGSSINIKNGLIHATATTPEGMPCVNGKLRGASIYLDFASVGATVNIILAAVMADGLTVIENAGKEPHIVDLANFLNSCGADIKGAGTDVIKIRGVERLTGCDYAIIPDQIEAGTYMVAAAATGGELLIKNVIPKHLDCISAKLIEVGVEVEEFDDAVLVRRTGEIGRTNVKTLPYPGFPTDMQPQMVALLSVANGTSVVTEGVWEGRFRYVNELKRMGADIQVDGKVAVIEGVKSLSGAPVKACDLRAGAALVIAGLMAQGETVIEDIHHIQRGYEDLVDKLSGVGANIKVRISPDPDRVADAMQA